MRATTVIAAAGIAAFAFAGCIRYEEHIHFDRDGSGWVRARLVVPRATADVIRSVMARSADDTRPLVTPRELDRRLRRDGAIVRRLEVTEADTAEVWDVEYAFRDLETFRRLRDEGRDVSLTWRHDGRYELAIVFSGDAEDGVGPPASRPGAGAETAASDTGALARLMHTFAATFVIDAPTEIVAAPGGTFSGATATFSWSYAREGPAALQSKTMHVIFRGEGLNWPVFETARDESPVRD